MKDYEYEEENLDDFMVNASTILSEENNSEKDTIIESLKQHLSSIFHIQNEMENFFKTLNGVIFTSKASKNKAQKIDNRQPFILYPIIFSFNPRTTSYFLDYYLSSLQQSTCEENRPDFTFLSEVFADVILAFFSDDKNNKYLIKKNYLLEQNKKKNLYEKILNFCNNYIKTNKTLEQSFGCLLLTEFIEKCPLVKEDKNLDNLFKIISDYLDDRWFESKLDLLNCTISLIFAAESKFKQYAKICLFRVLDYLTDMDWMKRKLAINIVYTLVFYCKDEILAVKENIFEFLNALKEDEVEEVREVCLHTLKLLGEEEEGEADGPHEVEPAEIKNENNKTKNLNNKFKNNNSNKKYKLNKSFETSENKDSLTNRSARSNKSPNNKSNIKLNKNEENLRKKLQKEQEFLEKMEKDFMEKKKIYNNNNNKNSTNNYSNTGNKNANNNYSNTNNKTKSNNSINNSNYNLNNNSNINTNINNNIDNDNDNDDNSQTKSKQNFNKVTPFENSIPESITLSINSILEQLKKIQEEQAEFRQMLTNLKQTAGNNYLNLNERLRSLEKNSVRYRTIPYNQNNYNDEYKEPRSQREFRNKKNGKINITLNKSDEKLKIEELKKKFSDGNYNEVLLETYQNDRYLLKLIPLMDRKVIPKIEIALLEDAISRLNKRLTILCMEGDRESINDVLLFYIQLLKSKKELKLITQLSIKDELNFLKTKGSNILTEEDIGNIERILGSLRV